MFLSFIIVKFFKAVYFSTYMRLYKYFLYILFFILFSLLFIFLFRFFSERQIDDVNPYMNCDDAYLRKSDIFYVVPKFKNIPINNSRDWCNYILSLNKTLYLHGIRHEYKEFDENISLDDFNDSINIFYDCFGLYPSNFKPPQIAISLQNKKLVKSFGFNLDLEFNQVFNKVYHCNDSGYFSNRFHDFI